MEKITNDKLTGTTNLTKFKNKIALTAWHTTKMCWLYSLISPLYMKSSFVISFVEERIQPCSMADWNVFSIDCLESFFLPRFATPW